MKTLVCSTMEADEELLMRPGLAVKAVYSGSRSQTYEEMGVEVGGCVGRVWMFRDPHRADAGIMGPVHKRLPDARLLRTAARLKQK